jgi:hypothetical protein
MADMKSVTPTMVSNGQCRLQHIVITGLIGHGNDNYRQHTDGGLRFLSVHVNGVIFDKMNP